MSASEHHARIEAFERDPELMQEVERASADTGGSEETTRHARTDAQAESILGASVLDDWPKPEPPGGELPPVPPFDLALVPEAVRLLVEDTAERMQVPFDYPAVVAILCLAGVTNRRAAIQPRRRIPRGSFGPIYGVALSPRQDL